MLGDAALLEALKVDASDRRAPPRRRNTADAPAPRDVVALAAALRSLCWRSCTASGIFAVVAERQDRIGQVIAQRYELLSIVGRGGQGIVYRARDRWMAREVALKLMGSKAVRGPQVLERLMREQQAMLALRGTAAVELFDVCRGNDGELCLVMELLRGTDLDEHLYSLEQRGERLTLPRIVEIFDPIVSTLEIAHAAGILHRDLKPANVFLLEGGGVRLLDFGMARLKKSAPLTAAGTVMGSPSFMAPEAWQGVSDLMDNRADVFSLGVILFRLLAGELPFGGTSVQEK